MSTRKRHWILAIVLAAAAASPASGQQPGAPSPLLQHYRAYAAALEQGDVVTAEAEAAAALAASIERYGDGGRTAVFALNLAGVRLVQGKYDAAVEPARKALALAETQGAASGVNPLVARLILGRAELRTGGDAAVRRLQQALQESPDAAEIAGEAYPAAVELAVFSFDQGRFHAAREAWVTAARFSGGSTDNPELTLATAKVGEAAAGIMAIVTKAPRNQLGTRIPVTDDTILDFDATLVEAMRIIRDQAIQASPDGKVTRAQAVWAQGLAWQLALRSKLQSEHREPPPHELSSQAIVEIGGARHAVPVCPMRVVAKPAPEFPSAALLSGGIGAVVLVVTVDEAGGAADVTVAASVGGPAFVQSITSVASRWRVQRRDDSPAGCRMAHQRFQGVAYTYN